MKIMYLVYSFTVGGTERLLIDICNQMVKNGREVFLYIVNDLYDNSMLKLLHPNVKVYLQKRVTGSGNILNTMKKVSNFIQENNISIVHCNSLNSPELLLISKLKNRNLKIIYTVHGINQYKNINRIGRMYRNFICNRIIAISNSVKDDIIQNGAKAKKVEVIYNAINTEKFYLNNKNFDIGNPIIGNVARIEPKIKGQDILVKAIKLLKKKYPNILCLFAGSAADKDMEDYSSILNYINSNNLNENIKFLGNIENIPNFLEKIDIFVLPSRFEGFGLSLIESMCMGVPCIASNIAGPKELIENEKIGLLFKSGDSKSLAKNIEKVLNSYSRFKKKSIESCEHIRRKYTISNMCDILDKVYKE